MEKSEIIKYVEDHDGFVNDENDFDSIWESECVERIDRCGYSGAYYNTLLYSVTFTDGDTLDICVKKESDIEEEGE